MYATLSSGFEPTFATPANSNRFQNRNIATANGLTVNEAIDLAKWLESAGYDEIEVIQTDRYTVRWAR